MRLFIHNEKLASWKFDKIFDHIPRYIVRYDDTRPTMIMHDELIATIRIFIDEIQKD